MNPRPHHLVGAGRLRRRRGRALRRGGGGARRDVLREPRRTCAASRPPAACWTSAATSARSSSWPSRPASRSRASSRRAGRPGAPRRACAGPCTSVSSRTRRCPRGPTTSSRCGTSSSTCPTRPARCAPCTRRCGPGGVFAVTTMDVEALFPRVAGPLLAVVHADAPRLLLAPHARRAAAQLRLRGRRGLAPPPHRARLLRRLPPGQLQPHGGARRARPHAAAWAIARWASTSATSSPWSRASPRTDGRARRSAARAR